MTFKIGDVVKINKRCNERHLKETKVRVGDCGIIIGMQKFSKYGYIDPLGKEHPEVRFFSGEIYYVHNHFLSKIKAEK